MQELTPLFGNELFAPSPAVAGDRIVTGFRQLNARRAVIVARLFLRSPAGEESTLIAKCFDRQGETRRSLERDRIFFSEERLNYRFLQQLPQPFPFAPRLLGETEDCFFLEDLGPGDIRYDSDKAMMQVVATSLASLHHVTFQHQDLYRRLRAESGLGDDLRAGLAGADHTAFATGAAALLRWCSILLPERQSLLRDLVDESSHTVSKPAGASAFLHYDLVSARQCVLHRGSLFLFDFEHARFGHRLLDLAKVMIGKLEITCTGKLLLIHPSLPASLAGQYRNAWESLSGSSLPDREWQQQILAALLYQTVIEVGQCSARPQANFLLGLLPTIRTLFVRLSEQLEAAGSAADPLSSLLARLIERMPSRHRSHGPLEPDDDALAST